MEIFFFLRAPYILRTTYFSDNDGGQKCQELKPYLSEKVKMTCHSIIHGARGLAMGVLAPIPLWLSLGRPGSIGPVHPKDNVRPSQPDRSPAQGVKADLAIKQDPGRLE